MRKKGILAFAGVAAVFTICIAASGAVREQFFAEDKAPVLAETQTMVLADKRLIEPETSYAKAFLKECEGQQWFIDYLEDTLLANQKTLASVTSDEDFNIIKSLGFSDKKIEGKIPVAIGRLKELRYLFLSGNRLNGSIPEELFSLEKLENIDLSGNGYEGGIPEAFGEMPGLKKLMLSDNGFTGGIPSKILDNKSIEIFDISCNKLSGKIPSEINNMTALTYLGLSDNNWDKGEFPDISGLSNLVTLSAWGCNITGNIPDSVYTLQSLQILDIADNEISGGIKDDIGDLVNLEYLSVGRNNLLSELPDSMNSLGKLKIVDIAENRLYGLVPSSFKDADEVYLEKNYLTGEVLSQLTDDSSNFCDSSAEPQYRLTASQKVQIFQDREVNIYKLLGNTPLKSGLSKKELLPAVCYEASLINDVSGKVQLSFDEKGIYLKSNDDILIGENIEIEICIKGNTGSRYSKVTVLLTTEAVGSSNNGGGTELPEDSMENHKPYISGYPDGTFAPGKGLKREEAVLMVISALEIDYTASGKSSYKDVSVNRWSSGSIEKATELGYINGYDGEFKPGRKITRAELAAILVKIFDTNEEDIQGISFSDVSENSWYCTAVKKAASMGIITGYNDGTFKPKEAVTRAEAVTMINRATGRDPDTANELLTVKNPFSDVKNSYWAYMDIMEAAVEHQH